VDDGFTKDSFAEARVEILGIQEVDWAPLAQRGKLVLDLLQLYQSRVMSGVVFNQEVDIAPWTEVAPGGRAKERQSTDTVALTKGREDVVVRQYAHVYSICQEELRINHWRKSLKRIGGHGDGGDEVD
jgi:hypothetical protein